MVLIALCIRVLFRNIANISCTGDGICDDVINVEDCLFDGDDCCRDGKIKANCVLCTCKMKFNEVNLAIQLKRDNVTRFTLQQGLEIPPEDITHQVTEVDNEQVCSLICMVRPKVTSWHYGSGRNVSEVCTCITSEKLSACNQNRREEQEDEVAVFVFVLEGLAQYSCTAVLRVV